MNEEEKEILVENLYDSLPTTINLKNLLGNEVFISWFLPRLKLIKEIQRWPHEKIYELTEIRLRNFLTYLNNNSVFWSTRFREYFLDLHSTDIFAELFKLPVINKTTLIEWDDTAFISHNNAPTIDYCTSGTTGVPLKGRIDEFDMIRNELLYVFEPDVFEIQRVDELLRRKFVLLIGRKSTGLWSPFSEYFHLDVYSAINDKKTRQEIYKKILGDSFICVSAYSSVALELMKYAREDGVALPLIAHISGEGISSEEERFIYDTTGVPITFQYNCKESGSVGEKCPINIGTNLYHIYRERVLLEIVDDNGNQLENDKEGNIILTVLDRTTMPIIRYLTGDRGRILSRQCSCDRLSPLLELQGRKRDIILLPGDDTFNVLLFRALFAKEIGLKNIVKYQIIQNGLDSLQISFIPRKKISLEKLKIIETILENNLKKKAKINIREVARIENYQSGKNKTFISLEEYGKMCYV